MPDPVAFQLGPLVLRWYGILLTGSAFLAAVLATYEARWWGEDPERVWDLFLVVLIAGVIGARLYHVVDKWDEIYALNPLYIIYNPQTGFGFYGLAMYGALIGGVLGLLIYSRFVPIGSVARWLDIAAPGILLAQGIARWGNYFNQEAYGYPTDLPWAITIAPEHRLPGYEAFTRFHPTFLYESLWNLLAFVVLMVIIHRWGRRLLRGEAFLLYAVFYSTGRLWVEHFRADSWYIAGFKSAQLMAVIFIAISIIITVYRRLIRHESSAT